MAFLIKSIFLKRLNSGELKVPVAGTNYKIKSTVEVRLMISYLSIVMLN